MRKKFKPVTVTAVLARRIGEERKRRGMSQRELAERVGLRREAVTMIENEKRQVTVDELLAIGDALNARPQDLIIPPEDAGQLTIRGKHHAVIDVRAWFRGQRPLDPQASHREVLAFMAAMPESELQHRIEGFLVHDLSPLEQALVDRGKLKEHAGDLVWEIKEGEVLREALRLRNEKENNDV